MGTSPAVQGEKLEGQERTPWNGPLEARWALAQHSQVKSRTQVRWGQEVGGSHPLSWSWPFHILALPNLALPFEI